MKICLKRLRRAFDSVEADSGGSIASDAIGENGDARAKSVASSQRNSRSFREAIISKMVQILLNRGLLAGDALARRFFIHDYFKCVPIFDLHSAACGLVRLPRQVDY